MTSLVVPGSSEKLLAKTRGSEVGEIVIDLEDAVVPDHKPEALTGAIAVLEAGGSTAPKVSVRINGRDTEWAGPELVALAPLGRLPVQRAPVLGEHPEEILADVLSPSDTEIGGLIDRRVGASADHDNAAGASRA